MDLNYGCVEFPHDTEFAMNENFGDTTLRLNCLGHGGGNTTMYVGVQRNLRAVLCSGPDDGCNLVLGLGPTPNAYSNCDHYCTNGVNKTNGCTDSCFSQGQSGDCDSIRKLDLSDCPVSVKNMDASVLGHVSSHDSGMLMIPVADEGSTSAKKFGGYMLPLFLTPRMSSGDVPLPREQMPKVGSESDLHDLPFSGEPSASADFSIGTSVAEHMTTTASSDSKSGNARRCKFFGCSKGARGASRLCIGHGGGQRCQKPGCSNGAESRTVYCKAHGGGRRCQHLGCTKSAEGKTEFCIAHGGGRRCGFSGGCTKAARGKSGLCIRHGGGKRCKVDGCARSAEGQVGLCISHGGGHRCQYQGCSTGAQGSTKLCKAHGGGKRCIFAGCTKGAEGSTPLCKGHGGGKRCLYDGGGICPKSVHGGTNFCVAHGGGKRCVVPGCTKSARGRTDSCVRHGGGKRCKLENCGKSAQGSTDYCKAHGGGKRCNWGNGKCEKYARGKSGLCAAHTSMAIERETNKDGGLIGPGLFHGLVSAAASSVGNTTYSSSEASALSECTDSHEKPPKRQHLIPPLLLVPPSMRSLSFSNFWEGKDTHGTANATESFHFMVPEGRVHGGGLMSLFGGNMKNAIDGI